MKHSINHLFHINASRKDVFNALSTIEGLTGWWTVQTKGSTKVNDTIQFRFGDHGGPDMKVQEVIPNESIKWECIASTHGWTGNILSFKLDDNEGKTRVRFAHEGWNDADDFYAICTFAWGRYMESLRQLCQTGKGEAFGSLGYRM
jgi:uncharacterized protein YndB with AHSA1/START domain